MLAVDGEHATERTTEARRPRRWTNAIHHRRPRHRCGTRRARTVRRLAAMGGTTLLRQRRVRQPRAHPVGNVCTKHGRHVGPRTGRTRRPSPVCEAQRREGPSDPTASSEPLQPGGDRSRPRRIAVAREPGREGQGVGVGRVSDWDEYVASIPRPDLSAARPPLASADNLGIITTRGARTSGRGSVAPDVGECTRPHVIPSGSESVPGKRGVWRIWCEAESDPPF